MGNKNTERVEHNLHSLPSTARTNALSQVLNDLEEYIHGSGFQELTRTGVFVTLIEWWDAPAKNKLRASTVITRAGVFVTSVVTQVFDQVAGTTLIATVTTTINRTGPVVNDITTAVVRTDSPSCPV